MLGHTLGLAVGLPPGVTVGLSLGITPYLSALGKLAMILLMFIGRVGPLTLAFTVGQQKNSATGVEYPEGRMMIG